ncbi:MAG: carbon storage regulator [Candidatus Eiseniibacteriota bacterium]
MGESVVINDNIELTVVEVRGKAVKLGFTFPSSVSVLRREIYERIQEENRAAAQAGVNISEALRLNKNKAPAPAPAPAPAADVPATEIKKAQAK